MNPELPTDTQVRAAMARLLADVASGTARATAVALAKRVGISRPALYRHYRHLVDELLSAAVQPEQTRRRRVGDYQEELAKLRRRNEDLRRHVEAYEEVIRQLTVDNSRLRSQLDQRVGIVDLAARRHDPSA
jgi:AcrR family transcriptional regulator